MNLVSGGLAANTLGSFEGLDMKANPAILQRTCGAMLVLVGLAAPFPNTRAAAAESEFETLVNRLAAEKTNVVAFLRTL